MPMPSSVLAQPISCFVGRERELAEFGELLRKHRLVSLIGPGGTGKTRLVLRLLEKCPEGVPVLFVDLSSASPTMATPAHLMATALGVPETSHAQLAADITEFIGDDQGLVVFDGCENLIDQVAQLTQLLLRGCPNIRVCCTSVEELAVPGEVIYRLGGLEPPDEDAEAAGKSEAVRLFLRRARAVDKGFRFGEETVEICRRLDGVPLYLEFAAEWAGVLSAKEIVTRLANPFSLLKSRSRTSAVRHRSLHSIIEHSYRILDEAERVVFRRVCVFRGGFTLDQALYVCADVIEPDDVLRVIHRLQATSFITRDEEEDRSRFRILESIRLFGLSAQEPSEVPRLRERVQDYLIELSEPLSDPRTLTFPPDLMARLAAERHTLSDAFEWARDDEERFPRLSCAIAASWYQLGLYISGAELCEEIAARIDEGDALAPPLFYLAAWLFFSSGDLTSARKYAHRLLSVASSRRLERQQIRAHWALGRIADAAGDRAADLHHSRRAHALGVLETDSRVRFWCTEYLAAAYSRAEDLPRAKELFDQAHSTLLGLTPTAYEHGWMLVNRAVLAIRSDELDEAESLFEKALAGARDKLSGTSTALSGLLVVAARRGNHDHGLRLAEQLSALPIRYVEGVPPEWVDQAIKACRSAGSMPALDGRTRETTVLDDASASLHTDGDVPTTRELITGALDRGELRRGSVEARLSALLLVQTAYLDRRPAELERVLELVERSTDGTDPLRLAAGLVTGSGSVSPGTRERLAELVPGPDRRPDDAELQLSALMMMLDEGLQSRAAVAHLTSSRSRPVHAAFGWLLLARDAYVRGRLDELQSAMTRGTEHADRHGFVLFAMHFSAIHAEFAACRGDAGLSDELCGLVAAWAQPRGLTPLLVSTARAAALTALGSGDYDSACRHFERLVPGKDITDFACYDATAIFDVVEAAVKSGLPVELPEPVHHAGETERASFLHTAARAMTVAGSAARPYWEKAMAIPGADQWRFDHARVRFAYGQWLRRERNLLEARKELATASQAFAELGAEPWTALAASELRAAGGGREVAESVRPGELTYREYEIAQLAAEGLSNKQIAERLYISSRTVSTHLHNIFPKLSVTSRAALRDALERYEESFPGEGAA